MTLSADAPPDTPNEPPAQFRGKVIDWPGPLPECNFCHVSTAAHFDTPTVYGPWADTCLSHFLSEGRTNSTAAYFRKVI